jgi:hypothetical protein
LPNLAFATPGTSQVTVNGSTFDVRYDVTGLDVTGIEADVQSSTVTVFVTTSDVSGTIALTLDRNFFDSKTNGEDDDFLVLADGVDTTYQESKDSASRTLTMTIPSGTNSVDVIALGSTSFGSGQPAEQPETTPPVETPVETTPPAEAPAETMCGTGTVLKDGQCVVEQPETTPPVETPEETAPPAEAPSDMTCGPGTVLKDGTCVLDQTCGAGTILKDGVCVLDQAPVPQATESRGLAFELIAPIVAAFVIAFVIMGILWAIGKAGRSKN